MKKLSDLEKEYHVSYYLLLTILLCIIRKVFLAYHVSDPFSGSGSIVYKVNSILSAIAILLVLGLAIGVTIIPKKYKKQTGRNYWYDRKHYMRPYRELVEYFHDADPGKMDVEDLPEMSWKESSGLIFGKVGNRLLSYEPGKDGIIAMIWGAPGDGKTTSTIIPSCRQFGLIRSESGQIRQEGAVMVTDLKGDIYAANRDYRHIKRFSTIDWKNSAHYDPLCNARNMKISDRAIYLENLAITIVPDEESSESKYFTDGARDFFSGISLYLLNQDSHISFPEIIEQIVIGNYSKWVLEIMKSDDIASQAYTNHFFGENEKNVSGTYSKLVSSVRLFSTEIMKTILNNDGDMISPADLENCTDIYLQIDPNQITLMGSLISMIYQGFLSAMLYRSAGQWPPIAFVIDEFGQIPAMPVIKQSAALLRAYNCSLMFSCQSLAMIEDHYGVAGRKLLMDCVKINCFLSIMDPDTRDWASRLIGTRKVLNRSNSAQYSDKSSTGNNVSENREKIFEPEVFGTLPNDDALIIYYKGKYIKAEKTYYFKE